MSPLPVTKPIDPVDREVGFMPTKTPYDPRWMLAGRQNPSKYFIRGSQIMYTIIITMQLLVIIVVVVCYTFDYSLCYKQVMKFILAIKTERLAIEHFGIKKNTFPVTWLYTKLKHNIYLSEYSRVHSLH